MGLSSKNARRPHALGVAYRYDLERRNVIGVALTCAQILSASGAHSACYHMAPNLLEGALQSQIA
ncbi:hypothetical protein P3T43_003944 [Paraburkholderia sp. GAS41]|jgi:hypothetical protein